MKLQELNDALQVYAHNGFAQSDVKFLRSTNEHYEYEVDISSIKIENHKVVIRLESKQVS